MPLYVITSTKRGKTTELARVKAPSGGLALRGKGEVISGDGSRLGFNVRRNQSVRTIKFADGRVKRVVKAKPVKE